MAWRSPRICRSARNPPSRGRPRGRYEILGAEPWSRIPAGTPRSSTVAPTGGTPRYSSDGSPETLQQGATGLFLDTVDVQDAHPETRQGVIDLLAAIRHSYPDVVLAINRGFTILETVLDVADAVAFESFSSRHDGTDYRPWTGEALAWTARAAAQLNARRGRRPVLAIDYAPPADEELRAHTAARARRYGFLSFTGTQALDWLPSPG